MFNKITKGSIFVITTGERGDKGINDRSVDCICEALKTFTPNKVVEDWLKKYPEQRGKNSADFFNFIEWLINESGLAKAGPISEFYLGSKATWKMPY